MKTRTLALKLYNSLTHSLEEFQPITPGKVRMYNCGPTVYKDQHIGNFRSYLMADLLRRYFDLRGFEVTQIMNITDVGHLTTDDLADAQGEDKLEKSARELGIDPWQIARQYEEAFHDNVRTLGIRPAHEYPRATDHIPEMIVIIEKLLAGGHAYIVEDVGVYFRVASFPEYGRLSGNTLEDVRSGARIEVDDRKESPLDFALWKIDEKHLMQWDSPWGKGFPGWHIECSAMSEKYLGETFDIHTGGEDNIFPHHECERAQSLCSNDGEFARVWVHARFLLVDGTKMSKSLDNFYTLKDLADRGFHGLEVRYALISSHHRQQANFTFKGLADAQKALARLRGFRKELQQMAASPNPGAARPEILDVVATARAGVNAAFDDDLNVSGALGVIFERMKTLRRSELSGAEAKDALGWLEDADTVLGVIFPPGPGDEAGAESALPPDLQTLIDEREAARGARDFARADELRDALLEAGIEIKDTPDGTTWRRR